MYGVSIFLSSQQPSDFDDFVFANVNSILALKLPAIKDAEAIAKHLSGGEKDRDMVKQIMEQKQFHGIFRNDHYMPWVKLRVTPFFERKPR